MSAAFIEPGTRLSGRYRLEELVRQSGGSSLWRAIDEILARPVAVRTFSPDFPHVSEVVTAARGASRLTDPRLSQVFDADDSEQPAYVVSEWVTGETLEAMILAHGPIEPGRAATLLSEASEALAAAHLAGLSHLRLTPRDLLWTTGNTVKILGLAVDGALARAGTDDPALVDTRGLGAMLYAALTGYWPGPENDPTRGKLPPAPSINDELCGPRQVVPGIPPALDLVVCRALDLRLPAGQAPLTSPAALAEALAMVPRVPLPLFAGFSAPPPAAVPRAQPVEPRTRPMVPPPPAPEYAPRPSSNRRPVLLGAAGLAAVVLLGLGALALSQGDGSGQNRQGGANPPGTKATTSAPSAAKLTVRSANALDDPNPAQKAHADTRILQNPGAVIDGKAKTVWKSSVYRSAGFGNYERGLGVVLDMGSTVKVDRVEVSLHGAGGATLELKIGDSPTLDALKTTSTKTTSPGVLTMPNSKGLTGRYVLLWFSSAPAGWGAEISEASVYGAAA